MDRLECMQTFVRVVRSGSFSAVAEELSSSQATISKRVASLEAHLGTQLLIRNSRGQHLTDAGKSYFGQAQRVIETIEEVENEVRSQTYSPSGLIRVTMPTTFARLQVLPLMPEFYRLYPSLQVQFVLHDKLLGLLTEGLDLAIRAGDLEDSSLVARRLGTWRYCVVASPTYLQEHGVPNKPSDISQHECLLYSLKRDAQVWNFQVDGKNIKVPVKARTYADSSDFILDAAIAGQGIAFLPYWVAFDDLQAGRVVQILEKNLLTEKPIHALYPKRLHLPKKVSVFVEYLAEKMETHEALGCLKRWL